jgi:predicted small lipoprotein YifL
LKESPPMLRKIIFLALVIMVAAPILAGCGRKGALQLPQGEEDQRRNYPAR